MAKIRQCVFPVAGMGTRFLPATKANPKEMLPIVDKPLVQYAAEEAQDAGATSLVFIIGRNKRAIPDHFDKAYELEAELKATGKHKLLATVRNILRPEVTCVYLRQPEALGLGHAIQCAEAVIGNEPFGVILADDLIYNQQDPCMVQMTEIYEREQCSVLAVEEVPWDETSRYGIVAVEGEGDVVEVRSIVEKPSRERAPSNLAVVGRYILTPGIFKELAVIHRGAGGEIQLTDAISSLLSKERVVAYRFRGRRYDCGSKLGYLQATVEYALRHQELGEEFMSYLRSLAACKDNEN